MSPKLENVTEHIQPASATAQVRRRWRILASSLAAASLVAMTSFVGAEGPGARTGAKADKERAHRRTLQERKQAQEARDSAEARLRTLKQAQARLSSCPRFGGAVVRPPHNRL